MDYRVTCTEQEPVGVPHTDAHIVLVGTVSPSGPALRWTVAQVYAAMDRGDRFYTYSERFQRVAWVMKWNCSYCRRATLRSAPDSIPDNNLDNLPTCR